MAAIALTVFVGSIASATHTVITSTDYTYNPGGWNGIKVYLSSPRHVDSGDRGECGWEENINGRHWNVYAASVNNGDLGSLYARHYKVIVSANDRVDGSTLNKNSSNNWGATVHIVTHTNAAAGGCGQASQYVLVMYRTGNANSLALRTELLAQLDPVVPGNQNTWNCDAFIECNAVLAAHRVYTELFFHTSQSTVNWYQAGGGHGAGVNNSWRYGKAVDEHLNYPR